MDGSLCQLIRVRGDIDAAAVPEESNNQPIQCGLPVEYWNPTGALHYLTRGRVIN